MSRNFTASLRGPYNGELGQACWRIELALDRNVPGTEAGVITIDLLPRTTELDARAIESLLNRHGDALRVGD